MTSAGGGAQQQRKPLPRAKVPPPSKIPSSAVEMPGDMGGYLDVQFGLDFGSEESFDQLSDRFGAATIDPQTGAGATVAGQQQQQQVEQDAYQQQQQQVKAAGGDQLGGYGATNAGQRGVQGTVQQQQQQQGSQSGAPAGYPSAIVSQYGSGAVAGNVNAAGQVAAGAGNKNVRSPYSNQGVAPGVAGNNYANATGGQVGYGTAAGQQTAQYSSQQQQQQVYGGGYNQSTGYNQGAAVNSSNNNQVSSQVQAVVNNAAAAAVAASQTAGQVVNSR